MCIPGARLSRFPSWCSYLWSQLSLSCGLQSAYRQTITRQFWQGCKEGKIEGKCGSENPGRKTVWLLSPRKLAQGSRRQEERPLLSQLDAVRCRGGSET